MGIVSGRLSVLLFLWPQLNAMGVLSWSPASLSIFLSLTGGAVKASAKIMSFPNFGWFIDYCNEDGVAQLHVCCCMYTCCMYAGSKFGPG